MRELNISLDDLEMAFEDYSGMVSHYLDVETGEVISVTEEERSVLDRIQESYYDEQTQNIDWETAFEQEHTPDWEREVVQEIYRVDAGIGTKYILIPAEDSYESYHDMEDFIETVQSEHLQELLDYAIHGKGAFRRFKDVLLNYPEDRELWFKFKRERLQERIIDWLDSEDIKLV
jgi:hypothetical protein